MHKVLTLELITKTIEISTLPHENVHNFHNIDHFAAGMLGVGKAP